MQPARKNYWQGWAGFVLKHSTAIEIAASAAKSAYADSDLECLNQ
jgi:hypothetical protein